MDDEAEGFLLIEINVGGKHFQASEKTLTKYPDSMLGKMFGQNQELPNPLPPESFVDGAYFIDADPKVFEAILTWLRYGEINLKKVSLSHLTAAASYFGLEDLHAQLLKREQIEKFEENEKHASCLYAVLGKHMEFKEKWGHDWANNGRITRQEKPADRQSAGQFCLNVQDELFDKVKDLVKEL